MKQLFFSLVVIVLLTACGGQRSPQSWAERLQEGDAPDSLTFRYARLIHVEQREGYRVVYIDNPWKAGMPLHTYILVPYDATMPHSLPAGTVVRTPLQRSVVFTSVHCALIEQLRATSQVAGVADLKYIKVPYVQEGVAKGTIIDCGDGMSPVIEKIIDSEADALLISPFENSGGYGRMEDIHIPIIECAEYMEQTPLARAEWMRFYGMLYGQDALAESLFREVEVNYRVLEQQAKQAKDHPTVLVDKMPARCGTFLAGSRPSDRCSLTLAPTIPGPTTPTAARCSCPSRRCWNRVVRARCGCCATTVQRHSPWASCLARKTDTRC